MALQKAEKRECKAVQKDRSVCIFLYKLKHFLYKLRNALAFRFIFPVNQQTNIYLYNHCF